MHAFVFFSLVSSDYDIRGCVTPKVIENLKMSIEEDMDLLDGYDEIPPEEQAKVARSLEQGHVDDEDWRGVGIAWSCCCCSLDD